MHAVTEIRCAAGSGDAAAADKLLPLVYEELRKLAAARLRQEQPGQTLQATALVHEAYLRLVQDKTPQQWNSRGHFFGAAAEAMRRIVIDRARRNASLKHGGALERITLDEPSAPQRDEELIAMDEALDRLEAEDPLAAKVVKLRFFTGLSHEEIATALEITVYLARQKWTYARAWLRAALKER
jgi:RNA polymerase sigma factor (TIGR02999 family)